MTSIMQCVSLVGSLAKWARVVGQLGDFNWRDEMTLYIDPPYGWMYGFPKPDPGLVGKALEDWLKEQGYPEKDIDFAVKHMR